MMWIGLGALLVVAGLGLWDRYRRSDGVQEWMLNVRGLDGLCRDYIEYVEAMRSGQYSTEEIRYFDSQRQVTHDQLLEQLDLDRRTDLDMVAFARRYLQHEREE